MPRYLVKLDLNVEVDADTREEALAIVAKATLLIPQKDGIESVSFDAETAPDGAVYLEGK